MGPTFWISTLIVYVAVGIAWVIRVERRKAKFRARMSEIEAARVKKNGQG